jgi:hypothetical protein
MADFLSILPRLYNLSKLKSRMGARIIILHLVALALGVLTIFQKILIPKLLMLGHIVCLGLCIYAPPELARGAAFAAILLYLCTAVYFGSLHDVPNSTLISLTTLSVFLSIELIFSSFHWPYGNEVRLSMLIPCGVYVCALFASKFKIQAASGLMLLMATEAAIVFSRFGT